MVLSIYIFLLIELIAVTFLDIRQKKIFNLWAILNLLLFVVFLFIFPDTYSLSIKTFYYSFALLGLGFILFILKIAGAGDSKYLFSLFLLIPVQFQKTVCLKLIYTTILVGIVLMIINTIKNRHKIIKSIMSGDFFGVRKFYGKRFSYAPLILISWIWFGWENRESLF